MPRARRIDSEASRELLTGACVVARNDEGVSVRRLADGRYLKVFRRRGSLTSDVIRPYARRFELAAAELHRRGFTTVAVDEIVRIAEDGSTGVIYRGVDGRSLRDLLKEGGNVQSRLDELIEVVPPLYARLHDAGVYFRANHFGNIILQPDGGAALIDVGEARFRSRPLSISLRVRNFKPPLRYETDRDAITRFGPSRFISMYLASVRNLSMAQRQTLGDRITQEHPIFTLPAAPAEGAASA